MLLYPLVQIVTSMLGFAGNHSDAPLHIDFDRSRIETLRAHRFDQPAHVAVLERSARLGRRGGHLHPSTMVTGSNNTAYIISVRLAHRDKSGCQGRGRLPRQPDHPGAARPYLRRPPTRSLHGI